MSEEIKGRLETAIANAGRMKMPLTEALYADALALITSLTAELTAARAEVERLRADKARLDFLDEANTRLNAKYGTTYRWKLIMNHNVNRLMIGHLDVDLNDAEPHALKSCRDAIDEKMRDVAASHAALTEGERG